MASSGLPPPPPPWFFTLSLSLSGTARLGRRLFLVGAAVPAGSPRRLEGLARNSGPVSLGEELGPLPGLPQPNAFQLGRLSAGPAAGRTPNLSATAARSGRLVGRCLGGGLGYALSAPGRRTGPLPLGPCWVPGGLQCRPRARTPCPGEGRTGRQDQGSVAFQTDEPVSHCVDPAGRLPAVSPIASIARTWNVRCLGPGPGGAPGLWPKHPAPYLAAL